MLQRLEQKQDFEEGKIQACTNLWRTCWWINTYYRSNLYNVDAARPALRSRTREHPVVRILPGAEHWSRPNVIDDMEYGEFYCQNKTTKEIILKYMTVHLYLSFLQHNSVDFFKGNKNLLNVSQINSHFQQINFMLHIFCLTVSKWNFFHDSKNWWWIFCFYIELRSTQEIYLLEKSCHFTNKTLLCFYWGHLTVVLVSKEKIT